MRQSDDTSTLWVYGTKGYGKSHLLAAFICYLIARGERVVYLPDCRESVKDPIEYMRTALLLAWADDNSKQLEIIKLDTMEKIKKFLQGRKHAITFIDQVNSLEILDGKDTTFSEEKVFLRHWLLSIMKNHKAVISTSANNRSFHLMDNKESSEAKMRVHGGLTEVSLL